MEQREHRKHSREFKLDVVRLSLRVALTGRLIQLLILSLAITLVLALLMMSPLRLQVMGLI